MAAGGNTKSLVRDLKFLVDAGGSDLNSLSQNGGYPLPPPIARARIGPASGIGRITGGGSSQQATAGIASPLTEPDYTTRTWHTASAITTTDGIFTFVIEELASIDLTDANGAPVIIEFAAS